MLVTWQQPGNERRAFFTVMLSTGVGRAENEYLTKLYAVCVFVLLGFLLAFSLVLFSGVSRAGGRNASLRLYSLTVSCLLLSVFVQRWMSEYRRRVCANVASSMCMPPLAIFRAVWFEPEYDTAWEAAIVAAILLTCDVVGAKTRTLYTRRPELKPPCVLFFVVSRVVVGTVFGVVVLTQLEYDMTVFWWSNLVLWTAGLLFSMVDVVTFVFADDAEVSTSAQSMSMSRPMPTVIPALQQLATPAFDVPGRVFLKRKKLVEHKKSV